MWTFLFLVSVLMIPGVLASSVRQASIKGAQRGCSFKDDLLVFDFVIEQYLGPLNEAGVLREEARSLFPDTLEMQVLTYGVEYPKDSGFISFNGQHVGQLTGGDDVQNTNHMNIPTSIIHFAKSNGTSLSPGHNTIQIYMRNSLTALHCTHVQEISMYVPEIIEPVLLVHGWESSSAIWHEVWIPWLDAQNLPYRTVDVRGTIAERAVYLRSVMDDMKAVFKVENVNYVAHSSGGLAGRHMLMTSDDVPNMVQLQTPNCGGSDLVIFMCDYIAYVGFGKEAYRECRELLPSAMQEYNRNFYGPYGGKTAFHSVGTTLDWIVPIESATCLDYSENAILDGYSHTSTLNDALYADNISIALFCDDLYPSEICSTLQQTLEDKREKIIQRPQITPSPPPSPTTAADTQYIMYASEETVESVEMEFLLSNISLPIILTNRSLLVVTIGWNNTSDFRISTNVTSPMGYHTFNGSDPGFIQTSPVPGTTVHTYQIRGEDVLYGRWHAYLTLSPPLHTNTITTRSTVSYFIGVAVITPSSSTSPPLPTLSLTSSPARGQVDDDYTFDVTLPSAMSATADVRLTIHNLDGDMVEVDVEQEGSHAYKAFFSPAGNTAYCGKIFVSVSVTDSSTYTQVMQEMTVYISCSSTIEDSTVVTLTNTDSTYYQEERVSEAGCRDTGVPDLSLLENVVYGGFDIHSDYDALLQRTYLNWAIL